MAKIGDLWLGVLPGWRTGFCREWFLRSGWLRYVVCGGDWAWKERMGWLPGRRVFRARDAKEEDEKEDDSKGL